MPRLSLTKANIRFIEKNRLRLSGAEMARRFGVEKQVVNRYMRNNGLSVPAELQKLFRYRERSVKTSSDEKTDKILTERYLDIPVKRLAIEIGRSHMFVITRLKQLGLVIPPEIIEQRKRASQIQPGTTPPNKGKKQSEYMSKAAIARTKKTRFRKGQIPPNTKDRDGVITIRYDHKHRNGRPYKYIRISLGKWVPYHQYKWEQKYGKQPEGMCVWFKDGNSLNCKLSNLKLITRGELAVKNREKFLQYPEELRKAIHLLGKLKKKVYEKQD